MITMGIMTVIIGVIVKGFLHLVRTYQIPEECKDWNKNHVMEVSLFLTGAVLFFIGNSSAELINNQNICDIRDRFTNKLY